MSKLAKVLGAVALMAGAVALTPSAALAQHHHWHGGGHWRGGGWGFGGPYYYGGGPYYAGPNCGWSRVRVWRHGYWVVRRSWRCW
jgi:hypothetical protein